jgi:branched-chain amino acid transport system substrate-binding protein
MSATTRVRLRGSRRLVPVAAVAMLAAACGGSSTTGSSGSQGAAGPSATVSAGAAVEDGVSDYLAYVGGTAGAADAAKSPVTIGWVNVESTANGAPEATRAAQAAVTYVNTKLGGVGGHPLALKTCVIATAEEEGQRCGQQMLNDDSVSAVAFGNVYVGDQSFNSVLAGKKPVLVSVATGPSVTTAKDTFVLFGDLSHVFGPWGTYSRDVLKARTAALLYTNTATDKIAAEAVRKGLEAGGVTVKSVGFDPQATDLIGPVTAAGAQTADVIVPISAGRGCVGIAKALTQLRVTKPVVATPICLSADVAKGLGGDLPLWTYGVAQTLPTDAGAADSKAYQEAATTAGLDESDRAKVWSGASWSLIMTYAKMINAAGPDSVTPQAIATQLAAFKGPVVMGAPQVACGRYPEAPAVCNDQARFYAYEGKGVFAPKGGWLAPPGA